MTVETDTEPTGEVEPATEQAPARPDWASVPRVNLLPPEILEARRFRRLQRGLAAAVIVVVGLLGAATWWAQTQVSAAEQALAAEQAQTQVLQSEQAKYAEVPKVLAQVSAARTARQQAMAQDVLWYRFLNDLATATPSGVSLKSVAATLDAVQPAGGAAAAPATPLKPAGIGSVTVEGSANSFDLVSDWLEGFADIPGLSASTLSNATREEAAGSTAVDFSTGITMTDDALSRRYEQKAG